MAKYATRDALRHKADWEGGLTEFIFGYGIRAADCPDEEVAQLVRRIQSVSEDLYRLEDLLYADVEVDDV